jgi:MYXO-CTERM domain-containing protein
VRITLVDGEGWAVVGTPSLMNKTEWNGYFLPAQSAGACLVGNRFLTNSAARTITVLPNSGTTVRIYDESTDALLDEYTSAGRWEFHNYFHDDRSRVELSDGVGLVVLVGSLNFGDCTEATTPAACGILEGGYSMPGIAGLKCQGSDLDLSSCSVIAEPGCTVAVTDPGDAGLADDASVSVDAGSGDSGAPDSGMTGEPVDGGVSDSGMNEFDAGAESDAGDGGDVVDGGCGCALGDAPSGALLWASLIAVGQVLRRRKRVRA